MARPLAPKTRVGQIARTDQTPARVDQTHLCVQVRHAADLETGIEQDLQPPWIKDASLHAPRNQRGQEVPLTRRRLLDRRGDLLCHRLAEKRAGKPDPLLGPPNPRQQIGAGEGNQLPSVSRPHLTLKLPTHNRDGNLRIALDGRAPQA